MMIAYCLFPQVRIMRFKYSSHFLLWAKCVCNQSTQMEPCRFGVLSELRGQQSHKRGGHRSPALRSTPARCTRTFLPIDHFPPYQPRGEISLSSRPSWTLPMPAPSYSTPAVQGLAQRLRRHRCRGTSAGYDTRQKRWEKNGRKFSSGSCLLAPWVRVCRSLRRSKRVYVGLDRNAHVCMVKSTGIYYRLLLLYSPILELLSHKL